jgi:sensor histidine kinase YesM
MSNLSKIKPPRRLIRSLPFLGAIFGILFITSFIPALYFFVDETVQISHLVIRSLLIATTPLIFIPFIYWVSVSKPLLKHWTNIIWHIALSLLFCLIVLLVFQSLISLLLAGEFFLALEYESITYILTRQFFSIGSILFFSYWGLVVLIGLSKYYQENEEMQRKANELESQLELATLSSLRAQLNPHFLFNTLSMVDQMITHKPDVAIEVADKLENLFKNTFERDSTDSCTLKEEIAFIQKYLSIEKYRFEDRLEVSYEIAENTANIHIPRYLLQPLVENAIVHGVSKRIDKCKIIIRAELSDEGLTIIVQNDIPRTRTQKIHETNGIGISNVRERIALFFGSEARLEVVRQAQQFQASVNVPGKYLHRNN